MQPTVKHPLIIDPEFQNLIPPLTEEERAGLEELILREGCTDPLRIWHTEEGDILIDGNNRYEICLKHNLPYQVEVIPGLSTRDDVKRWMITNQFSRRNLNESQRAMLSTALAQMNPGDNQHTREVAPIGATSRQNGDEEATENFKSPIGDLKTQTSVAETLQVGRRSVQRARKVHEQGIPELSRLVTEGKLAVSAAADVAGLPKEEQAKIVAGGADAVIAASREIRQQRKSATQESANPESTAPADPEALLPCGHCGSPAKYETFFDILRGYLHYATCTNESCGIQTPSRKKKDEVQAVWNRRSGTTD